MIEGAGKAGSMHTMTAFIEYFETYLLAALEKQRRFQLLVGDHAFELDLDVGKARFDSREYSFQVLGTESDNTLTWLWAWADEQAELSDDLIASARTLKAWGEHEHLHEFTSPSVDLDRADGTMIALIGSMLAGASCYYRDSYEGGALFILLFGVPTAGLPALTRAELRRSLLDTAARYDFNHLRALRSYLRHAGLSFDETAQTLTAELATGERLLTEFNLDGKLILWNGEAL